MWNWGITVLEWVRDLKNTGVLKPPSALAILEANHQAEKSKEIADKFARDIDTLEYELKSRGIYVRDQ